MQYKDIKQSIALCPDLSVLDEASAAALFWRGEARTLQEGEVIYAEGEKLDHTFCLLVSGDLILEKSGHIIGGLFEQQIFGEMAYFNNQRSRTATVRRKAPLGLFNSMSRGDPSRKQWRRIKARP